MQNQEEFLKEFEELIRKYEITIGACGCCSSPWLIPLDHVNKNKEEAIKESISWLK
jgi:hypothetical protein